MKLGVEKAAPAPTLPFMAGHVHRSASVSIFNLLIYLLLFPAWVPFSSAAFCNEHRIKTRVNDAHSHMLLLHWWPLFIGKGSNLLFFLRCHYQLILLCYSPVSINSTISLKALVHYQYHIPYRLMPCQMAPTHPVIY